MNLKAKWLQPKSRPKPMLTNKGWSANGLIEKLLTVGPPLLLGIVLILALSACCPEQVVYRKPEPYPLPPANLMRPPLNLDLVPPSLLPSNAKIGSTAPSSTRPK